MIGIELKIAVGRCVFDPTVKLFTSAQTLLGNIDTVPPLLSRTLSIFGLEEVGSSPVRSLLCPKVYKRMII